jgi:hypothetical protein
VAGFPRIVGDVDGTHVQIIAPSVDENDREWGINECMEGMFVQVSDVNVFVLCVTKTQMNYIYIYKKL